MQSSTLAIIGFLLCLVPTIIVVRTPRLLKTRVLRVGIPILLLACLVLNLLFAFYLYAAPLYVYVMLANLLMLIYLYYKILSHLEGLPSRIELATIKFRKLVLALYVFFVIVLIVYTATVGHEIRKAKILDMIIVQNQKSLPLATDPTTTLTAISRESGALVFDYTLKNGFDTNSATLTVKKELVLPRMCASNDRLLFDLIDTIHYRYHSENNQEIGNFYVNAGDCIPYAVKTL